MLWSIKETLYLTSLSSEAPTWVSTLSLDWNLPYWPFVYTVTSFSLDSIYFEAFRTIINIFVSMLITLNWNLQILVTPCPYLIDMKSVVCWQAHCTPTFSVFLVLRSEQGVALYYTPSFQTMSRYRADQRRRQQSSASLWFFNNVDDKKPNRVVAEEGRR